MRRWRKVSDFRGGKYTLPGESIGRKAVLVEIHMHTHHSDDGVSRFEDIEQAGAEGGVRYFAVTDHDTIEGALRLLDRGKVGVIVGEEVSTALGDVIGLFLEERIPPRLSPEATMDAIHEQGGLVYIPHPFDRKRKSRLFREAIDRCIDRIDLFEVWNGRVRHREDNDRAVRYAEEKSLVAAYGSDAHAPRELGRVLMEVADFTGAPSFLTAVREGSPVFPPSPARGPLRRAIDRLFRGEAASGSAGEEG